MITSNIILTIILIGLGISVLTLIGVFVYCWGYIDGIKDVSGLNPKKNVFDEDSMHWLTGVIMFISLIIMQDCGLPISPIFTYLVIAIGALIYREYKDDIKGCYKK